MAKLGDVCEKKIETLKSDSTEYIDYIDIAAVNNKTKLIENVQTISTIDAPSRAKQLVKKGDILVSTVRPNLNAVAMIDKDYENILVASTGYSVIRCNPLVNNRYVFYFCQSESFINKMTEQATGASYPAVSNTIVKNCEIPLPCIEEQNRIAKILDMVSRLISKRERQLLHLDELVKSRFIEMFGDLASPECNWRLERLQDICEKSDDIKCGPFGTQLSKDEYQLEGIALWEIPQINNHFSTAPTHFLTPEKAMKLDSYSIIPGDIAMSRKGNVGKCAVFPKEYKAGIIHSDVLRIRVDKKQVVSVFMMYQLHYSRAVQHQIELISSGAIMAGINVTKLKQIYVYLPPLDLQNQFADFVAQVDKSKLVEQRGLAQWERLLHSKQNVLIT